jgi:hypothetical protein
LESVDQAIRLLCEERLSSSKMTIANVCQGGNDVGPEGNGNDRERFVIHQAGGKRIRLGRALGTMRAAMMDNKDNGRIVVLKRQLGAVRGVRGRQIGGH